MSVISSITNMVYEIFEPIVGRKNVYISHQNEEPFVSVVIYSTNPDKCAFLDFIIYIEENYIYINQLENCTQRSMGLRLLNLLENLAKRIGVREILLVDASKIEFGFGSYVSLNTLYTLTTGQSWYNKLGYICKDSRIPNFDHKLEFEENKRKISNTTVKKLVLEVEQNIGEPIDTLLEEIEIAYPDLDPNKTIKEYFNIVKVKLQEHSNDIILLVKLIQKINDADVITTYTSHQCILVKEINIGAGKMRKKTKFRKAKTLNKTRKFKKHSK